MNNNANFFLAIGLSIMILMGFHWFYEVPKQRAAKSQTEVSTIIQKEHVEVVPATLKPRSAALTASKRIPLENAQLHGSINLKGARLDDITLVRYHETADNSSPEIVLLSPAGSNEEHPGYYTEFGWLGSSDTIKLPASDSEWKSDGIKLTPEKPLILRWDNGQGLKFERTINLDNDYMFTVVEKVFNTSKDDITLVPFSLVSRHGLPKNTGALTSHEGLTGVLDGQLREKDYKKLKDEPLHTYTSKGGWIGITDVYWFTGVIPDQNDNLTARFLSSTVNGLQHYQADVKSDPVLLKAGDQTSKTYRVFTGAKEVAALEQYGDTFKIPMFDKAVDFGWFYIIAKPFFHVIDWLGKTFGNYGLAIIAFTILLRIVFFPLSEASYRSMAAMKELKPEMDRLKERYSGDPVKMNEEVAKLYQKEKINPLSGCLPMLIQIPVFFALYKVLLISIEMRHAPFYGWIQDLSAKDPTNLFNLFGLLPFTTPDFLHIGLWPLLMGLTMFIQQKLTPAQADKTTQQIFTLMPIMFTFLFANMSAGLVIYWTISNILAIAQQTLIKHRSDKAVAAKS
ncbi:MAG: membrane protein insertase YidC [Alphaproteobacteria bacterium]|nr:membrane protein insertase YidC [Alphaproteobacteria bacterium]